MIALSIQLKLILFSFIVGFLFSISVECFNKKIKSENKKIKIILSLLLVFVFTLIYFIGIKKICYAIFHIYSILFTFIGFIFYDILIMIIAKQSKK